MNKPLSSIFGDYESFLQKHENSLKSKTDAEKSISYIEHQFKVHFSGKSQFYAYATCALDRDNCKKVFDSVRDYVTKQAIQASGFKV